MLLKLSLMLVVALSAVFFVYRRSPRVVFVWIPLFLLCGYQVSDLLRVVSETPESLRGDGIFALVISGLIVLNTPLLVLLVGLLIAFPRNLAGNARFAIFSLCFWLLAWGTINTLAAYPVKFQLEDQHGTPVGGMFVQAVGEREVFQPPINYRTYFDPQQSLVVSNSDGVFHLRTGYLPSISLVCKSMPSDIRCLEKYRIGSLDTVPRNRLYPYWRGHYRIPVWRGKSEPSLKEGSFDDIPRLSSEQKLFFDLKADQFSPTELTSADVVLTSSHTKNNKDWGYEWTLTLAAPAGGVIETVDPFMFEAPETGYQQAIRMEFQAPNSAGAIIPGIVRCFYLKAGDGRNYGKLFLFGSFDHGGPNVSLRYIVNREGSRDLDNGRPWKCH